MLSETSFFQKLVWPDNIHAVLSDDEAVGFFFFRQSPRKYFLISVIKTCSKRGLRLRCVVVPHKLAVPSHPGPEFEFDLLSRFIHRYDLCNFDCQLYFDGFRLVRDGTGVCGRLREE